MKKYLFFALIFLFIINCSTPRNIKLKPFSTDACSLFPEGTKEQKELWLMCCIEHDIAYWKGGTYKERLAADQALKDCVEEVGDPLTAKLMLSAVRVGGSPFWPTKFRWGYGWPYPRGYKPLTEEEKRMIEAELKKIDLPFLKNSDCQSSY